MPPLLRRPILNGMRGFRNPAPLLAAGALIVTAACATTGSPPSAQPATQATQRAISDDSLAKLEALYQARIDSSRMRFTEADVRFMHGMIAHHAQAITMSRWAPERTGNQALQIMAARIINAQQDEIRSMQQWLRDRRQTVPEVHEMAGVVMVHGGGEHTAHAPGMLTEAQMQQLERARGAEFDRLFLTYMIQHHRGAVAMVTDLFRTDGAGQDEEVYKLAADVQADQTSEITRMETMLKELSGTGGQR